MSEIVQRIVSLVPSMTETVCDLGVACRLVGISRYCAEPEDVVRFVPRVGGTKNPDRELVASLKPDLVVLNEEENSQEDIDWFKARFATHVSMPRSVVEAAEAVKSLGRQLGVEEETEAILLEIEAHTTRAEVNGVDRRPLRVFYPIWKQPWISVNRHTYIHDVLTRAGAVNVCGHRESRYPVIADQLIDELEPDLVLLPSEPYAFTAAQRKEFIDRAYFGRDVPILLVDGKNLCWHGSRSGRGLSKVTDLILPFRIVA